MFVKKKRDIYASCVLSPLGHRCHIFATFPCRIEVPRSQSGMTLTVTAVWETNAFTSPLWLYARKDDLPTESHYDKT